jgi:hypothetical protein
MLAYLSDGWFTDPASRRLRAEVVDGALDSAGALHRGGVSSKRLDALAARLRRAMPSASAQGGQAPHTPGLLAQVSWETVRERMQELTDDAPLLQGFVLDALEAVDDAPTLEALCQHLGQIAAVMKVLAAARRAQDALPPEAIAPAAGWKHTDAARAT